MKALSNILSLSFIIGANFLCFNLFPINSNNLFLPLFILSFLSLFFCNFFKIFCKSTLFFHSPKFFFIFILFNKETTSLDCLNISVKLCIFGIFLSGSIRKLNISGAIIEKSIQGFPIDNIFKGESFLRIFMLFSLLIDISLLFDFMGDIVLSFNKFKLLTLLSIVKFFFFSNSFLFILINFLKILVLVIVFFQRLNVSFLL